MYAILYLPEALWVRDIMHDVERVAKFDTQEAAKTYLIDTLIPFTKNWWGEKTYEEYYEIMEVEDA
jgi:hypothetical protein